MLSGRIVKGVAGVYDVRVPDAGRFSCQARGLFRKHGLTPIPGDFVKITNIDYDKKTGLLHEILPRDNELIRPKAANIDRAIVVFAASNPAINFFTLDCMLIHAESLGLKAIICVNKIDLAAPGFLDELNTLNYPAVYPVIPVSVKLGTGLNALKDSFTAKGGASILTGPSGVGKSSLVNAIFPELSQKTGDLSQKILRGKNTTRECEFFEIGDNSYIADSPGFTSFDAIKPPKENIQHYFPEFAPFLPDCYYGDCLHISEHDCAVKEHVGREISERRYESYVRLVKQE